MSTKKTPIHMRLHTLGLWYTLNRRNGKSRIQSLRDAWGHLRPVSIHDVKIVAGGAVKVGGFTIRPDHAPSDIAARISVLRPKQGDTIVVAYPDRLSAEQRSKIKAHLEPLVPEGVKAMVLDGGASLAHVAAPAAE